MYLTKDGIINEMTKLFAKARLKNNMIMIQEAA